MADRYANSNPLIGSDAGPGTIIAPKLNIDGGGGLLSLPHGASDSTQPSSLNLARDSTWLQQRIAPNDGLSSGNHLMIKEYGAGTVRPTIDWQNNQPGSDWYAAADSGSYTEWQNLRLVNIGPVTGHSQFGSRAFASEFQDEVGFFNCEVDLVAEDAFYIARGNGAFFLNGCVARRYVQRFLDMEGDPTYGVFWGGGFGMNRAPDVTGSGSATYLDNVIDRGIGEAFSAWQLRNVHIAGGIIFAARSAGIYANCVRDYSSERVIVYGTTDTDYHRDVPGYVGGGIATECEAESQSPGNDARSPYHANIRHKLHMVAFTAGGLAVLGGNSNMPSEYLYNADQITLVDNDEQFAYFTHAVSVMSAGSTVHNNASLIFTTGGGNPPLHGNPANIDVPSGLDIDYTNWIGNLGSRPAAILGANDPGSPFTIFKTSGWQATNDIDDLGAWTLVNGVLVATAKAVQFDPQTLVTTVQTLTTPALDFFGVSGLANPGAIRYGEDAPPIPGGTDQSIRVEQFTVDFGASSDTATVTYPVAGKNAESVWPHLRNVRYGSGGPSAGVGSQQVLAEMGVTIESQTASGCVLHRHADGTDQQVRVYLEVWFYDGPSGGDDEFIVRWAGTLTIVDTDFDSTQAISGVVSSGDLVAECLGCKSNTAGAWGHFARLSLSGTNTLTAKREDDADEVEVAAIVVEMTGANWQVEEVSHTFAAWNTTETETISTITAWNTAFIVASGEFGNDEPAYYGFIAWPGTIATQVRFRMDNIGGAGALGIVTAFVVRNPNMPVDHYDTVTGGATPFGTTSNPGTQYASITPIPDVQYAGLVMFSTWDENGYDATPNGWFNYRITDVDELEIWRSRADDGSMEWSAQVIDFSALTFGTLGTTPRPPSGLVLLGVG